TTGSGKSEFLQSYILSLAVHFHPYEVAFLLIDYKGGGMAQPFKNMPHLLGTITNIEGSENFSKRALASIKSELKRRQRLFDEYEENKIMIIQICIKRERQNYHYHIFSSFLMSLLSLKVKNLNLLENLSVQHVLDEA